jgi:hypothetical protein
VKQEWTSSDKAMASIPYLAGLHEDGFLEPIREMQLCIVDSFLALLEMLSHQSKQRGVPAGRPLSARCRQPCSSISTTVEQRLRRWLRNCYLFVGLSDVRLLHPSCQSSLAAVLANELHRCLQGASLQDIGSVAAQLGEGEALLERGVRSCGYAAEAGRGTARHVDASCKVSDVITAALLAGEVREAAAAGRHAALASSMATRNALQASGIAIVSANETESVTHQAQQACQTPPIASSTNEVRFSANRAIRPPLRRPRSAVHVQRRSRPASAVRVPVDAKQAGILIPRMPLLKI